MSASLRKIGCRCLLDDVKSRVRFKAIPIECFNRHEPLAQGWANFSERGPDETFGSSPRAEITNKNPEVTIT